MSIGDRIKSERTDQGLTQEQLEKLSGVSQQMISLIELGKVKSPGEIVPLAVGLGVTAEWLYYGDGPKYRKDLIYAEIEQLPARDQALLASEIHARLAGTRPE